MTESEQIEFDAFVQKVNENVQDTTNLLVFADWLRDHQEYNLEFTLRWMVKFGKRPVFRPDRVRTPWVWCTSLRSADKDFKTIRKNAPYSVLPDLLRKAINPEAQGFADKTAWQAVTSLNAMLNPLRELLGLHPTVMPDQAQ